MLKYAEQVHLQLYLSGWSYFLSISGTVVKQNGILGGNGSRGVVLIIHKLMSKSISGPLILLVVVFSAVKCVDPYTPKLSGYRNVMVVDGLVTNADNSYKVSLTESIEAQDSTPKTISDATVYITDDNGVRTDLLPAGNGIYKTDSLTFRGETGRTYQLHITRSDGNEYVSDSC